MRSPTRRLECRGGQASTEYLVLLAFMLSLLAVCMGIYNLQLWEASAAKDKLEANNVCLHVSSTISSFSSLNGNYSYRLNLTPQINSKEYKIYVAVNSSDASRQPIVRVDYGLGGLGCSLRTKSISNSTGASFFEIQKNATLRNSGGVLVIEP